MELSKSDAIDFAASVRKMVDELINEGFSEEDAMLVVLAALGGKK